MILSVTKYVLARINLVKAACPRELLSEAANMAAGRPIIVERNRAKFGFVEAADYFPVAVIVAGADTRSKMLKQGHIHGWALVERGLMELSNSQIMESDELLRSIQASLIDKYYPTGIYRGQTKPELLECYPLDGYSVYAMKSKLHAQRFTPNQYSRRIDLIGPSIEACSNGPMPRVDTGQGDKARTAVSPTFGALTWSNRGAANSELVTGIARDWTDIREAVAMYLGAAGKSHGSLRPRFEPVKLNYGGTDVVYRGDNLKSALVKAGIDPLDFAMWSAVAQYKSTKTTGSGDEVPRSKFLYAPSSDPSTWHLPVHDDSHIKNALARVNQTKGIPSDAKPGILNKLRKLAKHHGIGVSSKPTSGQKTWAGQVAI